MTKPPLFESTGLVLKLETSLEFGTMTASGPLVALWDAAGGLLNAMVKTEVIEGGSLRLRGRPPADLLSSGEAAYIPGQLPLPPNIKVLDALSLSARLVGLSKNDAKNALTRCRLTTLGSKKLGDLTRLQTRLCSVAHGIMGNPEVLLVENVFAELDEAESAILQAIFEAEVLGRSCIIACRTTDPTSRDIALLCDQAVSTAGNQALPPQKPALETAPGYWVSCSGEVTDLAASLRGEGAEISRSPLGSVLLVRRKSGAAIYRAAEEVGLAILELTPAGPTGDFT